MSAGVFERRRRDVEAARQRAGTSRALHQQQRRRARADEIYERRRADVAAARARETE